jgi:hypothetical protein
MSLTVARIASQTGRPIYTINGRTTKPVNEEEVLIELARAKVSSMKEDQNIKQAGEVVS